MSWRIGCANMNHQVKYSNLSANPPNDISDDLVRELANETGMARRQELMKAIWKLDRQAARPDTPRSARPESDTLTPEARLRSSRIMHDPGRRPRARTNSPLVTATPQNAKNRTPASISTKETLAALNELYATERFSLANYLRYAKPWVAATDQCFAQAIRRVSDEQLKLSERVGSLLNERRGYVENRSFPFRFTAYNDLSVAYLAPRVIEDQERIVRQVTAIADQLRADVVACDLASEILGAEKAHLDNLRELLDRPKSDTCHEPALTGLSDQRCQEDAPNVATAA